MPLITRQDKGSKLTIQDLDNDLIYLENLALNATASQGATGPQGPTGPQGIQGATGPQGPTGSGTENTFTMSAHPSLTLADVGKWVMSYSDPDFRDFVLNAGPTTSLDSYTGSQGVAKVVELTGAQDSSPGEWILDLSQEYNGTTWDDLIQNSSAYIFRLSSNSSRQLNVRNLRFQPTDPYLASIVGSLSYTQSNSGSGTFSFPSDEESAAIMIEYYANNGFPDSNYTADGSFGNPFPYHITTTQSIWTSATRSGTELTLVLDPSADVLNGQSFVQVYYFNNNLNQSANVEIQFSVQDSLQFEILGILEDVSGGVATISEIPNIYEFVVEEGFPSPSGTSSFIYTLPQGPNSGEDSIFASFWLVKEGGEGLINFFTLVQQFGSENLSFNYLYSSPVYTPLASGEVGTSIKFKRTNLFFNN